MAIRCLTVLKEGLERLDPSLDVIAASFAAMPVSPARQASSEALARAAAVLGDAPVDSVRSGLGEARAWHLTQATAVDRGV